MTQVPEPTGDKVALGLAEIEELRAELAQVAAQAAERETRAVEAVRLQEIEREKAFLRQRLEEERRALGIAEVQAPSVVPASPVVPTPGAFVPPSIPSGDNNGSSNEDVDGKGE